MSAFPKNLPEALPPFLNVRILASLCDKEEGWVRQQMIRKEDGKGLPCSKVGDDYFTLPDVFTQWIRDGLTVHHRESRPAKPRKGRKRED